MGYQSLYRRYRSRTFAEVLGQEHVTTALRNAVREDRVGHGYLFSGPRGTGKTSTARILAKVLNCEHPAEGEPDVTCPNCVAVEEGRSVDWLHELDAASNNGVDAMRDLLGRVSMGTSGNRKVYILDEVHMLSKGAANTLLKTLEEPPEHVVFVLATTEPEKVLPTIRSRTQHFDFKLLSADVLAGHVRYVMADAELGLDDDVVDHVVRAGAGSARDTLSALDQVAAAGGVEELSTPVADVLDALAARDAGAAVVAVDAQVRSGQAPRLLADALVGRLREAFLVAMGAPLTGLTDAAATEAAATAEAMGPASLTSALEAIGAAIVEMRHAPDPRIPLEVALVRLTRPAAGDTSALEARLERLERAIESGAAPAAPAVAPAAVTSPTADRPPEPAAPSDTHTDPAPADPGPTDAPAEPAPADQTPAPPSASSTTEAPPRGAAAARAKLAARGSGDSASAEEPTAAPAGGASRPSLGAVQSSRRTTPAEPPQPPATETADVNEPPQAEGSPPASDPPAPSEPSEPDPGLATELSVAGLTAVWADVLGNLRGRAKALYKPGEFVDVDGSRARLRLPSAAHCSQCEDKRDEVEAALAAATGQRVVLELVADDGPGSAAGVTPGGSPGPSATGTGAPPSADAPTTPDDDETVDLADLRDAPDPESGGLALLNDAFPGAEILEEER